MPVVSVCAIVCELNRRLAMRKGKYTPVAVQQCADGFTVSVQACAFAYCSPRSDRGPWAAVECGFPNRPMPTLAEWCEEPDKAETATKTVWSYVPIERVAALLAEHGGLVEGWTP